MKTMIYSGPRQFVPGSPGSAGRAAGDADIGTPELAVGYPPQVHPGPRRLPVQLAGQRHVAEPGDVGRCPSCSSHRSIRASRAPASRTSSLALLDTGPPPCQAPAEPLASPPARR